MKKKNIIRIALIVAIVLLVALVANTFVPGFNWTTGGFFRIGAVLFLVGLFYEFIASRGKSRAYRAATGIAVLAGLMLVWGTLVGGWLGGEDNPANLLPFASLAVGFLGICIARLKPRGMMYAAFATGASILISPPIALIAGMIHFGPGSAKVFAISAFFGLAFVVSGILYRRAG